jgi:hypothetical protein
MLYVTVYRHRTARGGIAAVDRAFNISRLTLVLVQPVRLMANHSWHAVSLGADDDAT